LTSDGEQAPHGIRPQPPATPGIAPTVQSGASPPALAIDAHARLLALHAHATLDRFAGLGHGIDTRVVDAILRHLGDAGGSVT